MRIAVDAMGGDRAPAEIVKGAAQAAERLAGVSKVYLVGEADVVRRELAGAGKVSAKLEVVHAADAVRMDEPPALAIRRKRDSSISRAVDLVKSGDAEAVVSAGNTGAVVVAATLKLRALEGVDRPAIGVVMPGRKAPFVLIDAGANTDCDANLLAQFAAMGSAYAQVIFRRLNPVVGLLSIGGEETKGNEITKQAFAILKESRLNFRGNIEGSDLFADQTDVVVCDGFVGNVVLKASESAGRIIAHWLREEFSRNLVRICGACLLRGALNAIRRRTDPEMYGGALLLGVNGICIITHGASTARAIFHAVRVACESAHEGLNSLIVERVGSLRRAQ